MRSIAINEHQLEQIEGISSAYPYVMHLADFSRHQIPWHWHDEFEIDYVLSGTLTVRTTASEYFFKAGEAFFMNSNVLCSMHSEDNCVVESHLFNSVFLTGHFRSIFETKYVNPVKDNRQLELLELRPVNDNNREIIRLLSAAASLQSEPNNEFETRSIFSSIWVLIMKEIESGHGIGAPVSSARQDRLMTMLSYIHTNYGQKITLDELAQVAYISKRECQRIFQASISKSPVEYIVEYRLEKAKESLRMTSLPIIEIALQTGFSNSPYFAKIFKQNTGMTPAEYRSIHREEEKNE